MKTSLVLLLFLTGACVMSSVQPMPLMPDVRALNALISDSQQLARSAGIPTSEQAVCVKPGIEEDSANPSRPHLISMKWPTYPEAARQSGLQGWVGLLFMIRADGHVEASSIFVIRASNSIFVEPAVHAFQSAVFTPTLKDGEFVEACGYQPVIFRLRH